MQLLVCVIFGSFRMVSHPRQKSTFYFHHNFLFATQLFVHNMVIFNTTFRIATSFSLYDFLFPTQLFVFNTTFYFQHNFLFSTQLFVFNTTFCLQHNFLFSRQLFIFNFFYPTAIHSCHVSRARIVL